MNFVVLHNNYYDDFSTHVCSHNNNIILCCSVLKLKADMNMRNAGSTSETSHTVKEEEVVMGTNQAYETVELRYQSASRNQQPTLNPQENISPEPVYENQQYL